MVIRKWVVPLNQPAEIPFKIIKRSLHCGLCQLSSSSTSILIHTFLCYCLKMPCTTKMSSETIPRSLILLTLIADCNHTLLLSKCKITNTLNVVWMILIPRAWPDALSVHGTSYWLCYCPNIHKRLLSCCCAPTHSWLRTGRAGRSSRIGI